MDILKGCVIYSWIQCLCTEDLTKGLLISGLLVRVQHDPPQKFPAFSGEFFLGLCLRLCRVFGIHFGF
jgi:hypothetical protein